MSSKQSFSSTLSVDPYNQSYYAVVDGVLAQVEDPHYSKEQFVLSYINTKDFITANLAVSRNIPDEDLPDAITNQAYDELALDQAIEYEIQFIESFTELESDAQNRHFHIFIVNPLELKERLEPVIETIKYIDELTPLPLLLGALYKKEILQPKSVDCFIYIQENDAFLTIYTGGEFLYTKSLKFSLVEMHERLCELYGERINYSDFLDFFKNANLKESESPYKKYFIKLYKELISNINDILTYAKRAYEIESFDRIYIGSQEESATKLDEMLEAELNIVAYEFAFAYDFEIGSDLYVDQVHALMQLYHTTKTSDALQSCNFTPVPRPPKFLKRESGKLILFSIATFIIAFSYPAFYWSLTYAKSLQKDLAAQKYAQIHKEKIQREVAIKNKEAEKEKAQKLLTLEEQEYQEKKNTLLTIHDVKVNYPMKAQLLSMFTKDINKFQVDLQSIHYLQEDQKDQKEQKRLLVLDLVARKDRSITKFVEYLTRVHSHKYAFSLQKILFDPQIRRYKSQLTVELL